MKKTYYLPLLFSFAFPIAAQTTPADLQRAFQTEFQSRILLVRGFPSDETMEFDSKFQPLHEVHGASWTVAEMEIQKIDGHDNRIVLSGVRVALRRDPNSDDLVPTRVLKKRDHNREVPMTIILDGPFNGAPEEVVKKVKDSVFISNPKELVTLVPSWWRPYLNGEVTKSSTATKRMFHPKEYLDPLDNSSTAEAAQGIVGHLADGEPVYKVKHGIVDPPRPISSLEPAYGRFALMADYQNVVMLTVVILANGTVGDVFIARPIGFGLDEEAIKAVQSWTFKPSIKDRKNVASIVNIEMSFNSAK